MGAHGDRYKSPEVRKLRVRFPEGSGLVDFRLRDVQISILEKED
ncbi:MAG: hypothetical protein Crog4KO_36650 [Crocinitomicaceae bacterium]